MSSKAKATAGFPALKLPSFQKGSNEDDGCISITQKGENSVRINPQVLRKLLLRSEIADKPIAIISITGRMRAGKSFLLNYFIRYFRKRGWQNPNWIGTDEDSVASGGIKWQGGTSRCTKGLMLFKEIFEVPIDEEKTIIVLLMDTQGLFDYETPDIDNKSLLTLSTMASSVQIFNAMNQLNTNDLGYLKTCMDFALATAEAEQAGGYVKLQRMMFLVRDFPDESDDDDEKFFSLETGQKYLSDILDSKAGGEENVAVRKRIKESFEDVQCFVFPHPGEKATMKRFSGKNKDLKPEFLELVKSFVEEIASPTKLVAKASRGKAMTGREVLNMITSCDKIFAQKIFEATNVMEANEKAHYATAYEEAMDQYTKLMTSNIASSKDITDKQFDTFHSESQRLALQRYNSALLTGSGKYEKQYRDHLLRQCQERYNLLKEKYQVEVKSRQIKLAENALKGSMEYEQKMLAHLSSAMDKFSQFHAEHYKEVCKKYEKTADIAELGRKVDSLYERLYEENVKRQEEHAKAVKVKRRLDLQELVFDTLSKRCNEAWKLELEQYCDNDRIKDVHYHIRDALDELYWRKALTEVEFKYKGKLDRRLGEASEKVIADFDGHKQSLYSRPAARTRKEMKTRDEAIYAEKVSEEVEGFTVAFREELELNGMAELEDTKNKLCRLHRRRFFTFCSEDVLYYRDLLKTDIIQTAYEKALGRNNENWELFEVGIRNKVKDYILEQEDEFEKIMFDRHISQDYLETAFRNAENDMKKEPPKKHARVIASSKRAKEVFEEMVTEMMAESMSRMIKRNEENQHKRMISRSTDVPEKKTWLRKAVSFFKPSKR